MKISIPLSIAACAFMTWSTAAYADDAPSVVASMPFVGTVFKMCDAEDGDGVVCDNGSDEVVLDTAGFESIAVDFSQSTASTLDCDIVGNNVGYDANNTGETLNSTAFSTTQYVISFTATPRFVWIYCTTTTGGTATATILGRR